MADCLFCKVVTKQIPARLVHEDDDIVAFEDINPQAPIHVLVVPKKHIDSLNDLLPEDDALVGKMCRVASAIAHARGIAQAGWRAIMNANRDAGQTVFHLHLHVLGGRKMGWPPYP